MIALCKQHWGSATPDSGRDAGSLAGMDRPAPDARKLLDHWDEWERGETPPGRVMSDLKTGGLRDLLQDLAAAGGPEEP